MAEESTAWPMVSRPVYVGGLGFGFKWDMGFMHDTLGYFSQDPVFRKYHHEKLTFRGLCTFSENFILPFSHDAVVHGKGSLLARMPGDDWLKLAHLRLLMGYMFHLPGKKLLFLGGEFGQWREWDHGSSLDWHLLNEPRHSGLQRWVTDLNQTYRREAALHQGDCAPAGFEWVDCRDAEQSTISWLRRDAGSSDVFLVVCNFTPVVRRNYRLGVPAGGHWHEVLNSDTRDYGRSGQGELRRRGCRPFPEARENPDPHRHTAAAGYGLLQTRGQFMKSWRGEATVFAPGGWADYLSAMQRYLCLHGHFYQPPRENPWLEKVERQDSAAPCHDWNERITVECYGPNATARILDETLSSTRADPEGRLRSLVERAHRRHVFDADLSYCVTDRLEQMLASLAAQPEDVERIRILERVAALMMPIPMGLNLWKVQNIYWEMLQEVLPHFRGRVSQGDPSAAEWVPQFAALGERLEFAVDLGQANASHEHPSQAT